MSTSGRVLREALIINFGQVEEPWGDAIDKAVEKVEGGEKSYQVLS